MKDDSPSVDTKCGCKELVVTVKNEKSDPPRWSHKQPQGLLNLTAAAGLCNLEFIVVTHENETVKCA